MNLLPIAPALLFLAACTCSTPHIHKENVGLDNARTSFDWSGVYKGVLPCENCDGIFTMVTLNADNSFKISKRFFGDKDSMYTAEGTIEWLADNNRIAIGDLAFRVGEERLLILPNKQSTAPASELTSSVNKVSPLDITDVYWKLVSIGNKDISLLIGSSVPRSEAHIVLHSYNQRMSGSNSCNRIMGGYEIGEDNSLKFKKIASTLIACPGNMLENFFNSALDKVVRYETDGKTLTLFSELKEELKFERVEEVKL